MDACGCDDFASVFDRRSAEQDRDRYRRSGPDHGTRLLLDLLRPYVVQGSTLLDVGGGIGVLGQELLSTGVERAVLVDASESSVTVAVEEAEKAGIGDRLATVQGDFVRLAAEVEPADVVTLDRVVCCYGDADSLVRLSAARARRVYGIVLPREHLLNRIGVVLINAWYRLRRASYRSYVHSNRRIDAIVAEQGLHAAGETRTLAWRIVVYARSSPG